ncbi:RNA-directed DNA polymerase, eukaryota [Tanacetum coccineum]
MGSQRTKEDDVARISTSIFVTNFPETCSAKDLFNTCKQYGHVVDAFIPLKRSKAGKRFGFVRFINVFSVERLVSNLCTIWIDKHKLRANITRFQRPSGNTNVSVPISVGGGKSINANVKVNTSIPRNQKPKGNGTSYVNVVKGPVMQGSSDSDIPALVLEDDCVMSKDMSNCLFGRVKEFASLANIKMSLNNEGFMNIKISYMGEKWIMLEFGDTKALNLFRDNVSVGSWFSQIIQASMDFVTESRIAWVEIEGIPFKLWSENTFKRIAAKWGVMLDIEDQEDECFHSKRICVQTNSQRWISDEFKVIFRGKVFWIRAKETPGWVPNFTDEVDEEENSDVDSKDGVFKVDERDTGDYSDVEGVPETSKDVNSASGNEVNVGVDDNGFCDNQSDMNLKEGGSESVCSGHFKKSKGPRTGGSILNLLDDVVKVGQVMGYNMDGCLAQKAKKDWVQELCVKNKVNILALQETKMENMGLLCVKSCWGNMTFDFVHSDSVGNSGGILCVWDPNAFRKDSVTLSDYFILVRGVWQQNGMDLLIVVVYAPHDAKEKMMLWEYLTREINRWKGKVVVMVLDLEVEVMAVVLTRSHKSAKKMSKLDRFFVSDSFLNTYPYISAISLERFLSDHRPILLREHHLDYGPTPFRFFHYWCEMDGFSKLVEDAWKECPNNEANAMLNLMVKLKFLKSKIRTWNKLNMASRKNVKDQLKTDLEAVEAMIDSGNGNEEFVLKRMDLVNNLQQVNNLNSMEMAQKANVKWAVEGDENSTFFHGMLSKKRSVLAVRGIMVDGLWIDEPRLVKQEFLMHFTNRFSKPDYRRAILHTSFPKRLSTVQQTELECEVSKEEIKRAVWDCGTEKAPGPDGFTFGFYRQFWYLIENDVYKAVMYFFSHGEIPKGCNSSFIALIPKIPGANVVKDFRPISLIGSLYKIIAKILANRLVDKLGSIVNEVQSAFIADRQILDGPFILDELIQWCKRKKNQLLVFKVDFEKAFDSVRWDFLDDILKKFGFGDKWRKWIQSCLRSSRGSIILNGSPTEEFQFHKGLKQGDPLSPFLFILVMESLHLSFKRVEEAGLFNGIKLDNSVSISHLFYADDAVFVGQWCKKNINTLVHVLECFFRASGLRINMSKSKLMGLHVDSDKIKGAASKLGCLTFKPPFTYLGSTVGGSMSRIQAWDDVVDRVSSRLSKWKMKMLSIGGRLTLGSTPIFHMSIYKAPLGVLQKLESIRSHFFNGCAPNCYKASWVNWKNALASKEKGGLGIASLYDLNRGLMFKWFWRFYTQDSSLWSRVMGGSCWMNIVKEVNSLVVKGIDLRNSICFKLGNGEKARFWEDRWFDGVPLKTRFPRLYALELCKDITVASKFLWGIGGLGISSSGEFSVSSVRRLIDDKILPDDVQKTRWVRFVPIKVNVIAWKVKSNSLPTRFDISRRGIPLDSIKCGICDMGAETVSHCFVPRAFGSSISQFDCSLVERSLCGGRVICGLGVVDGEFTPSN